MKLKIQILLIIFIATLLGCNPTKVKMASNPMINAIIKDYYVNNSEYFQKYAIFKIRKKKMKDPNLDVYTVIPENDEIVYRVSLDDSLSGESLATHYLEYKNKLFLWREDGHKTPESLIRYMYNRKLLDSSYVKYQMGLISEEEIQRFKVIIDDALKGATYIFCKSNPSKIKKKITSNEYIYPDDKQLQVECD